MRAALSIVVLAGCRQILGIDDPRVLDAAPPPDRGVDIADAPLFPTGPFGPPVAVVELNTATSRDDDVTLTADMLEVYFESDRGTQGNGDIYVAARSTIADPWSTPARLPGLSTNNVETSMEISADGLTLYFSRQSGGNNIDILVATRTTRTSPWSAPVLVNALNSSAGDYNATPSDDHLAIHLGSNRAPAQGNSDVFRSTRASTAEAWSTPVRVPGLDTATYEGEPFVDASGAMWFTSDGPGGAGSFDLWRAEPAGNGSFGTRMPVSELASASQDADAWLSPDGQTIYFTSDRDGSVDIYTATRAPQD